MKHLFLKYSWLPVLMLFSACMKEPVYPEEPQISFKNIEGQIQKDELGNNVTRIFITLDFKDGDGNLGLSLDDLNLPPFNDSITDPTRSKNYFIKAFYKDNAGYVPYPTLVIEDGYRFPRLAPTDEVQTLEGELKYFLDVRLPISLDFPNFKPGDSLKFEVYIKDRKLNVSNTVQTDPVQIFAP